MRMIRSAALSAALLLAAGSAADVEAQDWWFGFTWGASLPVSDTKDFADKSPSWRNFGIEGRKSLGDHTSLGFALGWNVFNETSFETTELDNTQISGTQFRYINAFPLLITGHYYIGERLDYKSGIRGFVGAGVGAYVAENRVDIGFSSFKNTTWHFGVAPEAGVAYKFGSPFAMFLSAKYNLTTKADDRSLSYWNFNVGMVWSN